jgi:glycosyltransferase involved in cell wall biosynthesis
VKIIALLPVRNEAWVLHHTLSCLSGFCDVIIVSDQDSTDASREICRRFAKVALLDPPTREGEKLPKQARWRLLDAARGYDGDNFLWCTDADELASPASVRGFLERDRDPLGAGYHVRQSQIAIGSGQAYGKGYLRGTQNQLNFLPEQHTDFIFSVYAEEWGFAGGVVLLLLYLALILRGAYIASRARDDLGALLAAGLTGTIFWQVMINISMTSGVLPVVGITLPFLSYGGSSMLALLTSIGLLMNVSMRRYAYR